MCSDSYSNHVLIPCAGPHGGSLLLSNSVLRSNYTDDQETPTPQVPVDIYYGYHLDTGYFTRTSPARKQTLALALALALAIATILPLAL